MKSTESCTSMYLHSMREIAAYLAARRIGEFGASVRTGDEDGR